MSHPASRTTQAVLDAVGCGLAIGCGTVVLAGATVLPYMPRVLLGGVLLCIGVWRMTTLAGVRRAWMPRSEHVLLGGLLVVLAAAGFVWEVGFGLAAAICLFVLARRAFPRRAARAVQVSVDDERVRVVQLGGYLFFAAVLRLLAGVSRETGAVFVIADFGEVVGMDRTAAAPFARLQRRLRARGAQLVVAGLTSSTRRLLVRAGCDLAPPAGREFPDLRAALAWCAGQLEDGVAASQVLLAEEFHAATGDTWLLPQLLHRCERIELPAGHELYRTGDPEDGLCLIERGALTAWALDPDGDPRCLQRMGPGTLFAASALDARSRSALSITCDEPACVHRLPHAALEQLRAEDPLLAGALQRLVATLTAGRGAEAAEALERAL